MLSCHDHRAAPGLVRRSHRLPGVPRNHRAGIRKEDEERKMNVSSRSPRIPVASHLLWLAAALLPISAGCKIVTPTSPERSLEARGEDLLHCSDPEGALAAFQQLAAMS